MRQTQNNKTVLIMQNKIFLWLAFGTGLILLIPFLAMHFAWRFPDPGNSISDQVVWNLFDFIVAGILIFGFSSTYVLVVRKNSQHRLTVGLILFILLLWLWAELAVGIFTNWGS